MKVFWKKYFETVSEFLIVGLIITISWQLFEKLWFGEVQQSYFDTLIALILTYSIVLNLRFCREIKQNEKKNKIERNKELNDILNEIRYIWGEKTERQMENKEHLE